MKILATADFRFNRGRGNEAFHIHSDCLLDSFLHYWPICKRTNYHKAQSGRWEFKHSAYPSTQNTSIFSAETIIIFSFCQEIYGAVTEKAFPKANTHTTTYPGTYGCIQIHIGAQTRKLLGNLRHPGGLSHGAAANAGFVVSIQKKNRPLKSIVTLKYIGLADSRLSLRPNGEPDLHLAWKIWNVI